MNWEGWVVSGVEMQHPTYFLFVIPVDDCRRAKTIFPQGTASPIGSASCCVPKQATFRFRAFHPSWRRPSMESSPEHAGWIDWTVRHAKFGSGSAAQPGPTNKNRVALYLDGSTRACSQGANRFTFTTRNA